MLSFAILMEIPCRVRYLIDRRVSVVVLTTLTRLSLLAVRRHGLGTVSRLSEDNYFLKRGLVGFPLRRDGARATRGSLFPKCRSP